MRSFISFEKALNFFRRKRRLAKLAQRSARRESYRRSSIQPLEERKLLANSVATFSDSATTSLALSLGAGQVASFTSSGTSYAITLNSGQWSGTNDGNVTGNGTSNLTVTSAGIAAFTAGIDLTGSNSANGAIFASSGASVYADSLSISLTGSSGAGLVFNGSTSFSSTHSLSATVAAAITINSGASLSMGSGSLSLASTGTNTALTDNGNITSASGAVTLEATGNVTVGTSVTINSGSGPLTLGADVTSAGAGDDGTGTLSIGSGAIVTSSNTASNAITLRGATMNITSTTAQAINGTPTTFTSGISEPVGMTIDSSGNLYVANNEASDVERFAPGATTANATYSAGLVGVIALAVDPSGNLYATDAEDEYVERFNAGSTTASATYGASSGLADPKALAVDSSSNLYIADFGNGDIEKFAAGSTVASATYGGIANVDVLAFDSSGNLYAAYNGGSDVYRFNAGQTTIGATYSLYVDAPADLAFDSSGNLYVDQNEVNNVLEFANGTTNLITYYSANSPQSIAFDSTGDLYIAQGSSTHKNVEMFVPGASTASGTFAVGVNAPGTLVADSSGDMYIAIPTGNKVIKLGASTAAVIGASSSVSSPTAGGVIIRSSCESDPLTIGGPSVTASYIDLTNAELATINTASTGTLTIGDTSQTGNITFETATPVTTSGAGLKIVEATNSAAAVVLGAYGTGLSSNGPVSVAAGTSGLQFTLYSSSNTAIIAGGVVLGGGPLNLTLDFPATNSTQTIIDDTATPAGNNPINGTFSNLAQNGSLSLTYSSVSYPLTANYSGGDGNDLVLNAAATATQLAFTTQPPTSTTAGSSFAVTVAVEESDTSVDTGYSGTVTLALASGSPPGTLLGTVTGSVSSGYATFTGLQIDQAGSGFELLASDSGLTSATSSAISIAPSAASQLAITGQPATIPAGAGFGLTVAAEDTFGNLVSSAAGSVTLSLASNPARARFTAT